MQSYNVTVSRNLTVRANNEKEAHLLACGIAAESDDKKDYSVTSCVPAATTFRVVLDIELEGHPLTEKRARQVIGKNLRVYLTDESPIKSLEGFKLISVSKVDGPQEDPSVLKVTNCEVTLPRGEKGKCLAHVNVTFNNQLSLTGLSVVEGLNGLFVKYPSKAAGDDYTLTSWPVTREQRAHVETVVLEKFRSLQPQETGT